MTTRCTRILGSIFMTILGMSVSKPGHAVDGVFEINQACAVNTGCFSGDTAGFPVKILAAGSYRLTSNVVVPDENTSGIYIDAPSVSIDLNGFEIIGAACVGKPTSACMPSTGTGSGVDISTVTNPPGTSVKNGSITGMGQFGVYLGDQAQVSNLRVRWNRLNGIHVSGGSTISANTSYQNGGDGIATGASTISDNTVHGNGGQGISGGGLSTISNNSASQNGSDGIASSDGSTITGNSASNNTGDGIHAQNGCSVSGNTAHNNTGWGLRLNFASGYSNNVILGNTAGTVTGGVQFGQNLCNGDTTCP